MNSPMLMNPEYLKFCKYYKGEEDVPWEKDYDTFTRFWILERDYYTNVYKDNHEYWENEGSYIFNENEKLNEYAKRIKDDTTKGFVAYAVTMTYSHNTYDGLTFIFKYKYDD